MALWGITLVLGIVLFFWMWDGKIVIRW